MEAVFYRNYADLDKWFPSMAAAIVVMYEAGRNENSMYETEVKNLRSFIHWHATVDGSFCEHQTLLSLVTRPLLKEDLFLPRQSDLLFRTCPTSMK